MRDLLLYIKELPLKSPEQQAKLVTTLERLYFLHIRTLRPLRFSEPARIASDLVRLEEALEEEGTIGGVKLRSRLLKGNILLNSSRQTEKLEKHKIDLINDQVIGPIRYFVPAVMAAEIINSDSRRERWRWLSTIVLSILTAILALIAKQLGDLH